MEYKSSDKFLPISTLLYYIEMLVEIKIKSIHSVYKKFSLLCFSSISSSYITLLKIVN